jgi:hypothetical protein
MADKGVAVKKAEGVRVLPCGVRGWASCGKAGGAWVVRANERASHVPLARLGGIAHHVKSIINHRQLSEPPRLGVKQACEQSVAHLRRVSGRWGGISSAQQSTVSVD